MLQGSFASVLLPNKRPARRRPQAGQALVSVTSRSIVRTPKPVPPFGV